MDGTMQRETRLSVMKEGGRRLDVEGIWDTKGIWTRMKADAMMVGFMYFVRF